MTKTPVSSACYLCGGEMTTITENLGIAIGARTALVEVAGMHCPACEEFFHSPEQMEAAQRSAAEKLRMEAGLLGPSEIRSIRGRFGLTQVQLEELLGVGPKTVVRWERGTVFQSQTADVLLRLIRDVPSAFQYLAQQKEVAVVAECSEPKELLQSKAQSRYVLQSIPKSNKSHRVVDIADWKPRVQHKRVSLLQQESEMPDIPVEALR